MKNLKKLIIELRQLFIRHFRSILYCVVFIFGIALIGCSFWVSGNWSSIASGVGTGLLTSLVVSTAINYENDARMKRKLEKDKQLVLNDIVCSSTDVYSDVIYRINEYIMYCDITPKAIYSLYDDFQPFNEFADHLKQIDLKKLSEKEQEHIETLFNIDSYRIDYLVAELKRLPKQEYYLKGLLTQEEYSGITSSFANDTYLEYVENIKSFWDDRIVDYEKCIHFMRMTLYICSKVIASIKYCKADVARKEDEIKDNLSQRYFDEIYSQSNEYVEQQIKEAEQRDEYYAEHPEEYESMVREFEELENETQEDRILKDVHYCICGFSAYGLAERLNKLDTNSEKALVFLSSINIQKALKKNWKKRKAIKNKFGKDYLKKAARLKGEK